MTPQLAGSVIPKGGAHIVRLLVASVALLLLGLATLGLVRAGVFFYLYTLILAKVTEPTGLDLWLARALTLALIAVAWLCPWHLLFLPWLHRAKRQVAVWAAILILSVAAMDIATSGVYFSRADGHPLKYYILTLDGFKLSSSPGTDPVHGVAYRPVTSEVAKAYILWKRRGGPTQDPAPPEGRYFDPATGEPLSWYAETPAGRIDMFALPGFHPKYGTRLMPATSEAVAAYERQKEEEAEVVRQRQEQEARQAELDAATEERRRQARAEEALRCPLKIGRYFFGDPRPSGDMNGFRFTLTEVDLTDTSMLIHLDADAESSFGGYTRLAMISTGGTLIPYKEIRLKEGDLDIEGDWFSFFWGRHGAFVLEFAAMPEISAFTIAVNDQPLIPINLRAAAYRSF